jgi:hypothetical protein
MLRKFLILSIFILLFTSAAFANVGHVQGFSIGSLNMVVRCGPVGSAHGGNMVTIGQSQQLQKPCFYTNANQQQGGTLVQCGVAHGRCGVSGVTNNAAIHGSQGQHVKPFGSAGQGQGLSVNLGQVAMKHGGVGGANGAQNFVGGQSQTISTPGTTSTESQFVGVGQFAAVSGSRGSNAMVVNSVNVNMGQGQNVTTRPVFPHYGR